MSEMKSAYELAMERMGGTQQSLTNGQRQQLSEIEARATAKIAEAEIMFDQQLEGELDPAKAALIRQTRQQQIQRIREESEKEKELVRKPE